MFKTVWIDAYTQKEGRWEETEELTGEVKRGLFGEKPVKKKRWVELDKNIDNLVDGKRLALDMQKATEDLAKDGYLVQEITPVLSGRYSWTKYGEAMGSSPTCASWGYSITEGVIITAKREIT
jgi:hypothetical protein